MTEEIRAGDQFEIPVEVTSAGGWWCKIRSVGTGIVHEVIWPSESLLSGKRLPRQIKAGDRVRLGEGRYTVVHVHGWRAWIESRSSRASIGLLVPLSDLTPDSEG
jgi:hypothetical protein